MEFVISNGQIIKNEEFIPFFSDGSMMFSRKIWFGHGGIPLLSENIESLKNELNVVNLKFTAWFDDGKEVFRITKRMLNKNKFYRSGIITINIVSATPETEFFIRSEAFPDFDFPFSKQGIMLNFSDLPVFSQHPLNKFTFFNLPVWKVAESNNGQFSNSVFQNEKGQITNCAGANLYCIKNKVIYTPSVDTGCWTDTLHPFVLDASKQLKMKIEESGNITKSDLLLMDEIFIASEEKGFQWVMGIGNKRFVHFQADLICEKLNELLKGKAA